MSHVPIVFVDESLCTKVATDAGVRQCLKRSAYHLCWLLFATTISGCATAPAKAPPELDALKEAFRHSAPIGPENFDVGTWQWFGDPVLNSLINRAQIANLDVRIAQQRVIQARAGSTAAASRLLPTASFSGAVSDQRSGLPEEIKRGSPDTRVARVGVDFGWEVDVFGAASAAVDAAEFDALAADAGVYAAQWLASTEVARQYILWQGARLRLQQLDALLQTQRDTERLTRSRQASGLASRFDVIRAAGEVQSLAAQLPPLRTLVAVTEAQIGVLLGESPSTKTTTLDDRDAPVLPQVPPLSAGQPIELLKRRPDLRAAQQQLLAEGARLRESEANLWPRLFLAAALGQQDLRLNLLDLSPVSFSNVALSFTAPLFNGNRLRAAVERQSAQERIATLNYERAVLGALQDVENSLVALAQERERSNSLAAAVDTRREGLRHAMSLFREGQIDLLQLLDAQRALLDAELAATDGQARHALGAVQLVRALGGGWHTTGDSVAQASLADSPVISTSIPKMP